jgi:2-polyprenyl-3-methyl-5-hydroxy-6-metoxy-1,4-benzoquinol methylase
VFNHDARPPRNLHSSGTVFAHVLEKVALEKREKDGEKVHNQREKWDKIYSRNFSDAVPALVLTENASLIPDQGHALDLACGAGANAIFLAQRGLTVDAWDISDVAIAELQRKANTHNLQISARVLDITPDTLKGKHYDVIVNCHYLDRAIMPMILKAASPSGIIFFQTFCRDKRLKIGPTNPDFLLAKDELKLLTQNCEILVYRDAGPSLDTKDPLAGRAYIVVRA